MEFKAASQTLVFNKGVLPGGLDNGCHRTFKSLDLLQRCHLFHYTLTTRRALWVKTDPVRALIRLLNSGVWDKAVLFPSFFFFRFFSFIIFFSLFEWWWKWKSRLYVYFDKFSIVEHLCFVLHRILKMFHHSVCTFMETAMLSFFLGLHSFNKSFIPLPRLCFLACLNVFAFCSFLLPNRLLL